MNVDRRDLLKGAGGVLAAGAALSSAAIRAAETDECGRVATPATFLLIPGMWDGGFVYDDVTAILRNRGHRVFPITQTGIAEKSHLLTPDIGLETFILDITNLVRFEEMSDIVLAGHSFGGMSMTGAADRMAHKIRSIVHLDALLPDDGQSAAGLISGSEPTAEMLKTAPKILPQTPQAAEKIPQDERWRYTPNPLRTMVEPVHLTGAIRTIAKKTFIRTQGQPEIQVSFEKVKDDPSWKTRVIQTGHMMMREAPKLTAQILEDAI